MDFDSLLAYLIDTVPMPAKIAAVMVVILAIVGGGYAAWRMIQKGIARTQSESVPKERNPLEISGCSYCAGVFNDNHPYESWWRMDRDVKDFRICIEHVLKRCEHHKPEKPVAQRFDSWLGTTNAGSTSFGTTNGGFYEATTPTTSSSSIIDARIDARIAAQRRGRRKADL